MYCGESGIRTPEGLASLTVFKTAAFNHSANSPNFIIARIMLYLGYKYRNTYIFNKEIYFYTHIILAKWKT